MLGRLWEMCADQCPPERPCPPELTAIYRARWDRERLLLYRLPLARKLQTFFAALWRHLLYGAPTVSASVLSVRQEHCLACQHRDPVENRCLKCGCPLVSGLFKKLRMARERCPVGKWPRVRVRNWFWLARAYCRFLRRRWRGTGTLGRASRT